MKYARVFSVDGRKILFCYSLDSKSVVSFHARIFKLQEKYEASLHQKSPKTHLPKFLWYKNTRYFLLVPWAYLFYNFLEFLQHNTDSQSCFLFISYFFLFSFKKMFIYFWERQKESKWGRGRERGRQRIPSRLRAVCTEPIVGLKHTGCKIMIWAKTKSQMLNWLKHPGAPILYFFLVDNPLLYYLKLSAERNINP